MTDTIFRTKSEEVSTPTPELAAKPLTTGNETIIEVPYLDYQSEHHKPFLVDNYNLGSYWDDPEGGYSKEIDSIEGYLKDRIASGEIANSIDDIKRFLKTMERTNNLTHESRAVIKLEVLSNYVEFMQKNANLKSKLKRYANA